VNDTPSDSDPPETPKPAFRFKPTEFERANRPLGEPDKTPAIDVRDLYQHANAVSAASPQPARVENEVHAILRANLVQADEAGLNAVELTPQRASRRKREYWLLLVGGNLLIAALVFGLSRNVVVLVFAGSGMIFYSLALTWIMWMVMDDY
jgi:hypothetical protein